MVAGADGPEGESPEQPGSPPDPPPGPGIPNETVVLRPVGPPAGTPPPPAGPAPAAGPGSDQPGPTPSFPPFPPPPGGPGPQPGPPPAWGAPPPATPQPGWGAPTPAPGRAPAWLGRPAARAPGAGGAPPGWQPPTGPGPVPPDGEKRKRRKGLLFLLLAVVLIGALVAALLVVSGGDDSDDDVASGDEILLLAADEKGDDAFADDLTPAFGTISATAKENRVDAGESYLGTVEGLHGGTRGASECERDAIAGSLGDDEAEAFADVLDADSVDDALADLTPVVLMNDTRVTDYGFRDGEAIARQAVLQEGTGVLVDDRGVPRVRSASGNPLDLPVEPEGDVEYASGWGTFRPDKVVAVQEAPEAVDVFVLTDVDSGDRFVRPVGTEGDDDADVEEVVPETTTTEPPTTTTEPPTTTTTEPPTTTTVLGTGDVQFTLQWTGTADLDLYVTDPDGTQLSYAVTASPSGGQLDVDANAGCGTVSPSPTENIFWPTGMAPLGSYIAGVSLYDVCDDGAPVAWTLTVLVDGQRYVFTGAVADEAAIQVAATVVRGEGGGVTPGEGVTATETPTGPPPPAETTAPGAPPSTTG